MKKMLVLGLILFVLVAIAGCSKDNGPVVSSQPGQASGNNSAGNGGSAGGTTPVSTGSSAIDLNLEKVTWSTIHPEPGEQVGLKITVKNVGSENIDGFDYNIRITKDGTEWKDETLTYSKTLYPGNRTKIEQKYTFSSIGKYEAEVYLDKDNKLGEKNRFNNVQISMDAEVMQETSTADLAGNTNSNNDEEDNSGSSSTSSGSSSSGNCVDTDDGVDASTRGSCDDGESVFGIDDYCKGDATTLVEWYCDDKDTCQTEEVSCESGCESGVCI